MDFIPRNGFSAYAFKNFMLLIQNFTLQVITQLSFISHSTTIYAYK